MPKLNWSVPHNPDGSFVRRRLENDGFDLDYIDVAWTHTDGFNAEHVRVPTTHPPDIQYETRHLPAREVVHDQVSVSPQISDATVAMMLDEKRVKLAQALGVEP